MLERHKNIKTESNDYKSTYPKGSEPNYLIAEEDKAEIEFNKKV